MLPIRLLVSGLLFPLVTLTAGSLWAADPPSLAVEVPQGDKVTITVPEGWSQTAAQPSVSPMMSVKISNPDESVAIMLTFVPDPQGRFGTQEAVDKLVTQGNQQYVDGSVEKKQTLVPLETKNGHGSYAVFTDASLVNTPAPEKGNYRCSTSGLLVLGKEAATFTVLSNEVMSADYLRALKLVTEGIQVSK